MRLCLLLVNSKTNISRKSRFGILVLYHIGMLCYIRSFDEDRLMCFQGRTNKNRMHYYGNAEIIPTAEIPTSQNPDNPKFQHGQNPDMVKISASQNPLTSEIPTSQNLNMAEIPTSQNPDTAEILTSQNPDTAQFPTSKKFRQHAWDRRNLFPPTPTVTTTINGHNLILRIQRCFIQNQNHHFRHTS